MTIDEVLDILGDVTYPQVTFFAWTSGGTMFLRVSLDGAVDLVTRKPLPQLGRKWVLSEYMTKSEVVSTAFKAVMTAIEHEAREAFRYKRRMIYGPHFDVDALHEIAHRTDFRPAPAVDHNNNELSNQEAP